MAGIFISYRRDDSRHAAGRLADDLVEAFGDDSIFRDIEGIEPGVDFTEALDKALGACVVMLVVIGPRWLGMEDSNGERRLDQPGDWIRMEIATALQRQTRVIPVLLEGAELPLESDLPADIRHLVRRQAFELADGRWRGDIERLINALAKVPGLSLREPANILRGQAPQPRPRRSWWWLGGVAAALLTGVLILGLDGEDYLSEDEVWIDLPPVAQYQEYAEPEPIAASTSAAPTAKAGTSAAADMSGLWRTNSGEIYHVNQNGTDVEFYAELGGQPLGVGRGRLEGQLLRITMSTYAYGAVSESANCEMQAAADGRSYSGMCNGTNGAFPAQIYR